MYYGYRLWCDGQCIHEDIGNTYYSDYNEALEEGRKYAEETALEWNENYEDNEYTEYDIDVEVVELEEDEDDC